MDGNAVFVRANGRIWPVNGFADANAVRFGYEPDIRPIWSDDREAAAELAELGIEGPPPQVNIGDLIDYGLRYCAGR